MAFKSELLVIFFCVSLVYGAPQHYPQIVSEDAINGDMEGEDYRRLPREDAGLQFVSEDPEGAMPRTHLAPTADVHGLLDLKKPLLPALNLGLIKHCHEHKPIELHKPKLPVLPSLPILSHAHSVPHTPLSWESVITEDSKPHTHLTSLPYIHGYKLTPLYSQKQIIVKDFANNHQPGFHPSGLLHQPGYISGGSGVLGGGFGGHGGIISPHSLPVNYHENQEDGVKHETSARAASFIPGELQEPYGLDITMQNQINGRSHEYYQPMFMEDTQFTEPLAGFEHYGY